MLPVQHRRYHTGTTTLAGELRRSTMAGGCTGRARVSLSSRAARLIHSASIQHSLAPPAADPPPPTVMEGAFGTFFADFVMVVISIMGPYRCFVPLAAALVILACFM
jgi:hypothetical protein